MMDTLENYQRRWGIDVTPDEWEEIREAVKERINRIRSGDLMEIVYLEVVNELLDEDDHGL